MKNITVNVNESKIFISKPFSKRAYEYGTLEYSQLQEVRRDYPTFAVEVRGAKKNPNKETYKGLTYDYMREYITLREEREDIKLMLDALEKMIFLSKCHSNSRRYPTIKKWFLEQYPEVAQFGIIEDPAVPAADTLEASEQAA